MTESSNPAVGWVRGGAIAGILSGLFYLGAATLPLPTKLAYILAVSFGPLAVIAWLGLYSMVRVHRESLALRIATIYGIVGGTVVNLMLTIQISIHHTLTSLIEEAPDEAARSSLNQLNYALASVHLGLDVAWDMFIGGALTLFGLAILSHPRFGRVMGALTMTFGLLVLGLNLYTMPVPPAESGLFDIGPFAGLWAIVLFIQMLRSLEWMRSAPAPA